MFDTIGTPGLWAAFAAFVVAALAIDLWVMDRRSDQTVGVKAAAVWSIFWIALALAFGAGLWLYLDGPPSGTGSWRALCTPGTSACRDPAR